MIEWDGDTVLDCPDCDCCSDDECMVLETCDPASCPCCGGDHG